MENSDKKIGIIETNDMEEFEKWRDDIKKDAEFFCDKFEKSFIREIPEFKKILNDFPKCMVQFTRQMCNCDQDCLSESFYNNHFIGTCSEIDYNNLFISRKYIPCGDYKVRVSEGKLYKDDEIYTTPYIGQRINEALTKLCNNDQEYYDKLLCAAYELRDECELNPNCVKLFLQSSTKTNCENKDFFEQIQKIEHSSGLDEFNITLVDTNGFESIIYRIGRDLRYAENLDEEIPSYYDQAEYVPPQIMIESNSHDNTVTAYGYIMGMTLFSILGYITYKIYKKFNKNKNANDGQAINLNI